MESKSEEKGDSNPEAPNVSTAALDKDVHFNSDLFSVPSGLGVLTLLVFDALV